MLYDITQKKEIFPEIFWDKENTIKKYAPESAKELMIESMPNLKRKHVLDYDLFDNDWKIQYDYKGNVQNEAERIVLSNQSYHIDGRAGTGKTYLVNQIVTKLKEEKIKYICLSPTNKGARLIHGATIHSLYYKFKKSKKLLYKLLHDVQYIIIDEVSMMSHDFYQLFILLQRSFESLKFIICGDFDQLPPVQDSWTGDYKNCHALFQLCSGNRIQLTQCKRSDNMLFDLCKNVEIIDRRDFPIKNFTYKNIAYTHKTRIQINDICMVQYQQDNNLPSIQIKKDIKNPKTQDIILSKGMPILCHKTNKKINILNSEIFYIHSINKDTFSYINNEKIKVEIQNSDFHKYFYPGFCITVYASQGETYNEDYTIFDWDFIHFSKKAKYVALSRSTKINHIQIA